MCFKMMVIAGVELFLFLAIWCCVVVLPCNISVSFTALFLVLSALHADLFHLCPAAISGVSDNTTHPTDSLQIQSIVKLLKIISLLGGQGKADDVQ